MDITEFPFAVQEWDLCIPEEEEQTWYTLCLFREELDAESFIWECAHSADGEFKYRIIDLETGEVVSPVWEKPEPPDDEDEIPF